MMRIILNCFNMLNFYYSFLLLNLLSWLYLVRSIKIKGLIMLLLLLLWRQIDVHFSPFCATVINYFMIWAFILFFFSNGLLILMVNLLFYYGLWFLITFWWLLLFYSFTFRPYLLYNRQIHLCTSYFPVIFTHFGKWRWVWVTSCLSFFTLLLLLW